MPCAVVVSCPFSAPPLLGELFSTSLPNLVALSIHGFYPFPSITSSTPTMPKLERLWLSGNRNPHGLLQLGALEAAAPTLTHLRVSEVALAAPFARELHAAALPAPSTAPTTRVSSGNAKPTTSLIAALPSSLKSVVIDVRRLQPRVHYKGTLTRGMQNTQEKMLALLREV